MVPENSTGSCGMMESLDLKSSMSTVVMSTLSMHTRPLFISIRRNNTELREVFPENVQGYV